MDSGEEVVRCEKCKKLYKYIIFDWGFPGGKEREYAYCPYCNEPGFSKMTDGVIHTSKLTEKEEQQYEAISLTKKLVKEK